MRTHNFQKRALSALAIALLASISLHSPTHADEPVVLEEMKVIAERLNIIRNNLSPKTGGSAMHFDQGDIAVLPGGVNTSLKNVLLQAPGVANDSYGQLHVRGDHSNLQYRINGIILPDGINGFTQGLDTRIIDKLDFLTGALPAQYGYRTAGVVEIQTKTRFENGGRVDIYGGSRDTLQPGIEYGGATEKLAYYLSNSYLRNNIGIENPTSSYNPIHDQTEQNRGFGYASYTLNPKNRVSVIFGSYDGYFQIPNTAGLSADPDGLGFLTGLGLTGFNSAALNDQQRETNRYGIAAWQSSIGPEIDTQLAFFSRSASVHFQPDVIGGLAFNGIASDITRTSFTNGFQGDASYRANSEHTIRMGFYANNEDVENRNTSTLFPVDGDGNVNGSFFTVRDNKAKDGNTLLGLYLQDEWRPVEKLKINYGLRYDRMSAYVTADQISPRVGAVYDLSSKTSLHAAYARYFTPPRNDFMAPNLALFANTSNAPENTVSSPAQPERSHYFDVGATHMLTPHLGLGVDGFYKKITDLLDEGRFGQALIFTPFNYQEGKIYGVEFTAHYRKGNLNTYANLARTVSMGKGIVSSQFNFDQELLNHTASNWVNTDHDQRYSSSAGISYLWLGTLFSANANYGSGLRRGFANSEQMPYTFQVNLGATHLFNIWELGPVEGRLGIINALDRVNAIRDGSGIGVGAPQFGPRIGAFAGISKSF